MHTTSKCLWVCGLAAMLCGCGQKTTEPVTATPPTVQRPAAPTTEQRLAAAEAAADSGEYETALDLFRRILAENPTLAIAYVGIGEIYLARSEYERAEPVLARAARLEPRNFEAQFGHGVALQMLERFVEAARAYHRALTIRPDAAEANLRLAEIYLQTGEARSALVFAEKAVEVEPANGPARAHLGTVYLELGRDNDAIVQYEFATELMEPTPPLLLNLVNALTRVRRYVDARNTADYLIRLEPTAEAYERLGYCWFRLGDYGQSIDAYRRAVELDPEYWPALNGVGCNALNKWLISGKRDTDAVLEARQALRRSLQINPDQQQVIALLSQYGV